VAAAVLILLAAIYFSERAFRYAQRDPLSALLGGAQYLKAIEHQWAASDKSIVVESETPQIGGPKKAVGRRRKADDGDGAA
jgi:hypothetical protein